MILLNADKVQISVQEEAVATSRPDSQTKLCSVEQIRMARSCLTDGMSAAGLLVSPQNDTESRAQGFFAANLLSLC
jgi:hypothetical protein